MKFRPFGLEDIPDDWVVSTVSDVSKLVTRGKQPKYQESGTMVLNQKMIQNDGIHYEFAKRHDVTKSVKPELFINQYDIVLNSTGTGTAGRSQIFLDVSVEDLFMDSHVTLIRPDLEKVNPIFMFAQLHDARFVKYIEDVLLAGSTGQVELSKSKVLDMPILLPPLSVQDKFGELYESLMRKQSLLGLINDNLSQLMMLVFEKFQDENTFDESTIGAVASLSKGLSYKSEFLDPDNTNPDSKFFISLSNFDITGGFKFGKMKYYFGPYKERHIVHPGDLLSGATDVTQDRKILGSPVIVPNLAPDMLYSLDVFKIDVDEQLRNWLYMQMQTPSYRGQIEGAATGTTVLRVPKDVIENFKIALPDERQLDEFNTLITPFIKMQELNFDEIRKLEDTRDTLLAKLIN